jgi:CheY-like chemotaxis protein
MVMRNKIAIIDDDSDLVTLFCDVLSSSGLSSHGFNDPLRAIRYLTKHHGEFRLVITDWKMPEIGGREMIKLISQLDQNILIMLISAYELDLDEFREIRKDDYISKPVHIAQFVDAVKNRLYSAYEICVG